MINPITDNVAFAVHKRRWRRDERRRLSMEVRFLEPD
jgi:uncharacterized membrane protein